MRLLDSAGVLHALGPGFRLTVPAGTTARADSSDYASRHGMLLSGPLVTTPERSPDEGPSGPQPTFGLLVSITGKPANQTLAQWVDSLRTARNAQLGEEASLPPAVPGRVGSEPALQLEPYCGDCEAGELYVTNGEQVVVFAYDFGIHLAGARTAQQAALTDVLRTFRWTAGQP